MNMTSFPLDNLVISLSFSENVDILPLERYKRHEIEQIGSSSTYSYRLTTKLKEYDDCVCNLLITIPAHESCPFNDDIKLHTLYNVLVSEL